MKKVTRFQANDGKVFDNKARCIEYDDLLNAVSGIMLELNPIPKMNGCDFENGHGFVQQEKDAILSVRKQLLTLASKHIDHPWIAQSLNDITVHPSYAGRLIAESSFLEPVYRGWNRISNIDHKDREWGQGYFAAHPEKAPALKSETIC